MLDKDILILTKEVLDLEDKFEKNRHGPIRDDILKKKAILKKELNQRFKTRSASSELFESQ